MTPEAQRIAIAEACGWTDLDRRLGDKRTNAQCDYCGIPDYLNDLDAMHEAEKVLTDEQRKQYSETLGLVVNQLRPLTVTGKVNWWWMAKFAHATAAQRAEAFRRTLGLWKD
jgi:hypothetical protein